jgi:hypothetical protein
VCVNTFSICFVKCPLSLIDIFICMLESSLSVGFVVLPKTLGDYWEIKWVITIISCSIRPFLRSITISLVSNPLPMIDCTTLKRMRWFCHSLGIIRRLELFIAGKHCALPRSCSFFTFFTFLQCHFFSYLTTLINGLHFRGRIL